MFKSSSVADDDEISSISCKSQQIVQMPNRLSIISYFVLCSLLGIWFSIELKNCWRELEKEQKSREKSQKLTKRKSECETKIEIPYLGGSTYGRTYHFLINELKHHKQ